MTPCAMVGDTAATGTAGVAALATLHLWMFEAAVDVRSSAPAAAAAEWPAVPAALQRCAAREHTHAYALVAYEYRSRTKFSTLKY